MSLHIHATTDENSELTVTLPVEYASQEVTLMIVEKDAPAPTMDAPDVPLITPETTFTDEEIVEMTTSELLTGAEIVARGFVGGWEHLDIQDPLQYLAEIRGDQQKDADV